jgi:curli biogenesis system outer membrane secretion channel CsgG
MVALIAPGETIGDVLFAEMSAQSRVALVERAALQRILREYDLGLSGQTKDAMAVGKLVGADFLLFAWAEAGKLAIRLVEVASGKVLLEEAAPAGKDLFLAAAAIRERVLKALQLEPEIKERLTIGITAFPNRSGTDRADKLGIQLQAALRERLRQEKWATVLERQYPTHLLEEVELARLGLAKGPTENLPPADLVVCGSRYCCATSRTPA